MFIGHLPAGYLWTRFLTRNGASSVAKPLLATGLAASVLPDLDLLFFYVIDNRQYLHHSYWPHIPILWGFVFCTLAPVAIILRAPKVLLFLAVIVSNALLHLALDTIAGGIVWLYPLSARPFVLVDVPAVHGWWVWNFVLHWSFAFEVLLWLWAGVVFFRSRQAVLL